jgi:hypothetical protein
MLCREEQRPDSTGHQHCHSTWQRAEGVYKQTVAGGQVWGTHRPIRVLERTGGLAAGSIEGLLSTCAR